MVKHKSKSKDKAKSKDIDKKKKKKSSSKKIKSALKCPICHKPTSCHILERARWLSADVQEALLRRNLKWRQKGGACPACIQKALLQTLVDKGNAAMYEGIQSIWPLDVEAAFGAIPTPLRMHADPRFTGKGTTIAMVDSAFYPHPDLTKPKNRIKAWVNATTVEPEAIYFSPEDKPRWPKWDSGAAELWHGMMTTVVAAGNGWLSQGLYHGIASDAEMVLLQVYDKHIASLSIYRALQWLNKHGEKLNVNIVNLSVGGGPMSPLAGNPIDVEIAGLVRKGITVVVASGNDGVRRLNPPATAPQAITIGGLDDGNTFNAEELRLWNSSYGDTAYGEQKPELVAPSIWLAAPLLPNSKIADNAKELFEHRAQMDMSVEEGIKKDKLITPYYQHVDGTSFASPIVASTIACMLEANPKLTPHSIRDVLIKAACPIPNVPIERQGAGALDAGKAVAFALRENDGVLAGHPMSPKVNDTQIIFVFHDHEANNVNVIGNWDYWAIPGLKAKEVKPGVWKASMPILPPGKYFYRFLINNFRLMDDPANPLKFPNGDGGLNSILIIEQKPDSKTLKKENIDVKSS